MTDPDSASPEDLELYRRYAARRAKGQAPGACPDARDLAAYHDGRADKALTERIEAHLARCDDCLAALIDARELDAAPAMLAPPRVIARARALVPAVRPSRWRSAVRWATGATAAVVIGYLGFAAGVALDENRRATSQAIVAEVSFDQAAGEDDPLLAGTDVFEALLAQAGGVK